MSFDKTFNSQSLLVKVLLLIIPVVGWVVEILVRLSVFLKDKSVINLIAFIAFCFGGVIFAYIDLICLLLTGHLFLAE